MCNRCKYCGGDIIAGYCYCDNIETAAAYRRRMGNIRHRMAEAGLPHDDDDGFSTTGTKSDRWWAMGHRRRGPIAR